MWRVGISLMLIALWATSSLAAGKIPQCNTTDPWNYDVLAIRWTVDLVTEPRPDWLRLDAGTDPDVFTIARDVPADTTRVDLTDMFPAPAKKNKVKYYLIITPLYGPNKLPGPSSDVCVFDLARSNYAVELLAK